MTHSAPHLAPHSASLFERAQRVIPGGVNSPVRAFRGVGGVPRFIQSASGSRLVDADGASLIDYVGSWGPLILGHAHPKVIEAIESAMRGGTSYGCPTEREVEMAELICSSIPTIEMIRMVNSGTEAAMSVIRLARGATGRAKIVKMIGCYHGHVDSLLVKAGSGVATLGLPDSPGVTPGTAADTITVPYNDLPAIEAAFSAEGDKIAGVILEPVVGNMGLVAPRPGYLQGLRDITARHGALLIFDEVMTGFRVAFGGAQTRYGIKPDLSLFGKVIGGGLPVGAYGGRRDLMQQIAPSGPIYQAGTLSGNPLAMAAGLATLKILKDENVYAELDRKTGRLLDGIASAARDAGIPLAPDRVGSMFGFFFQDGPVIDWETAKLSDTARYGKFFHAMLDAGFYFAPSQYEAGFMSAAHSEADIDRTIEAVAKTMKALAA